MLTKDVLQNQLYSGQQSAIELLYTTFGGMIYAYIRQFAPDESDAQHLLVTFFSGVAPRLQEACDSNLSIYSWLQIEARKTILDTRDNQDRDASSGGPQEQGFYASLLKDASPEHQEVFSKLFLHGIPKEDLASQTGKDPAYIEQLLRESLLIIRNRLG